MEYTYAKLKSLPQRERPRERLRDFGPQALSDAELLAIVIGSGRPGVNALDLARSVLKLQDDGQLLHASLPQLESITGIGLATACRILASLELGVRLQQPQQERLSLRTPAQVAAFLEPKLRHLEQEEVHVVLVDVKQKLMHTERVSQGSVSETLAGPREVFRAAVRRGAYGLIVAHNHPSGDPTPSQADVALTLRLRQSAVLLGIELIDHIIIGQGRFVSLRQAGLAFEAE